MPVASGLYYHFHLGKGFETLPVVLLHGAGGNLLSWPPVVRRLTGVRVYALDLPGHGKSHGRGQQSIAGYARSVMDWLETVGLHRAAFVGHSMGGAIALELAIQYPNNVLALGLISSGIRLPIPPDILAYAASPTTYRKASEALCQRAFTQSAAAHLVKLVLRRMTEVRQSVIYGDLMASNEYDVGKDIEKVRQPALVLCGSDDLLTPLRYSQSLADALPSARLVVLHQEGHMVMLENPPAVAEALEDFLLGVPYFAG